MDDSMLSESTTRRKTQNKFIFNTGLNFNQKVTSSSLSHIQKKYNFNTTTRFNSREHRINNHRASLHQHQSNRPSGLLGKSGGFGFGEKTIKNNLVKMEPLVGMGATTSGGMVRGLPTIAHRNQYFGATPELTTDLGMGIKDNGMEYSYKKKSKPKNSFGQNFSISNNKNSIGKFDYQSTPSNKPPYF
jgi:hypothetical protein